MGNWDLGEDRKNDLDIWEKNKPELILLDLFALCFISLARDIPCSSNRCREEK